MIARVIGLPRALWHRYARGHRVAYVPALVPDEVVRREDGRPLINVFVQDRFQRPDAHYHCTTCGREWP